MRNENPAWNTPQPDYGDRLNQFMPRLSVNQRQSNLHNHNRQNQMDNQGQFNQWQDISVNRERSNTKKVSKFRIVVAEVIGTAIYIYVGCSLCEPQSFALGMLIPTQIFRSISGGHFNPAITIAAVIMNKVNFLFAIVYIIAQFVGAILGYAILYGLQYEYINYCSTSVNIRNITLAQACIIESVATAIFIMFVCSFWEEDEDKDDKDVTIPLKISLAFYAALIITYKLTGGSLNTPRSLVPDIFGKYFPEYHWVYWVGPNVGALIGAIITKCLKYEYIFCKKI